MNKIYTRCLGICLLGLTSVNATAQLQGNALDYLLQKPAVTKHYPNKRFGDHLFTEIGGGLNVMGRSNLKAGVQGGLHVGDWATPEHGWRLGIDGGRMYHQNLDIDFASFSLDYLLNITAVANRNYTTPKRFEVYGIAGGGVKLANSNDKQQSAWEAHLGLRGQYALSPFTYLYLEAQAGMLDSRITNDNEWRKFKPHANLTAGLGYRLGTQRPQTAATNNDSLSKPRILDGMYLTLAGGPSILPGKSTASRCKEWGGHFLLGLGKDFDPYHGIRLAGNATYQKLGNGEDLKAFGVQLDYLLNLHSLFGGPRSDRKWAVNLVAGAGINASMTALGAHTIFGTGGGFQGVLRLNNQIGLTFEPRVDAYASNFNNYANNSWHIMPNALIGMNYYFDYPNAHNGSDNDKNASLKHNYYFIEGGIGGNLPITRNAEKNIDGFIRPQVYAAVGKWFNNLHGVRIWAQGAETQYAEGKRLKHVDVGADYLFHLTNALCGYDPDRVFDLSTGLGMNISRRQARQQVFFGMNASLRASWHLNPMLGLYIEPKLQAYGKHYLPTALRNSKLDWIASASAGVQLALRGYDRKAMYQVVEDEGGLPSSISFAGGVATQLNGIRNSQYYGPLGRLSYTHWFSPVSAWRANVQGFVNRPQGKYYGTLVTGADYVADLTAHTYGYDPNRVVSIRALAGFNMGIDYYNQRTKFVADIHAGGQLSVRVGGPVSLYLEPQLAYRMSKRLKNQGRAHIQPQLLLGVDYSFNRPEGLKELPAPERKHFVSAAIGSAYYSHNIHYAGRKDKFAVLSGLSYGQWLNGLHGVQATLSHAHTNFNSRKKDDVTAIGANYLLNLRSAITGESTADKVFQLTGIAGASLQISKRRGTEAQVTPGFQFALQAGWKVSPEVELFVQPEGMFLSKHIRPYASSRPFEGAAALTVGTKYCF